MTSLMTSKMQDMMKLRGMEGGNSPDTGQMTGALETPVVVSGSNVSHAFVDITPDGRHILYASSCLYDSRT